VKHGTAKNTTLQSGYVRYDAILEFGIIHHKTSSFKLHHQKHLKTDTAARKYEYICEHLYSRRSYLRITFVIPRAYPSV